MSRLRIGALLAAGAVLVAACGGATATPTTAPSQAPASQPAASEEAPSAETPSQPAEGTPKSGGTLVVALPGDLNRSDPSIIDDANSSYILAQSIETLVTLKPGTGGDIIPWLADSWTISPDGKDYTFKLHPGIKFHDGTDFNAAAVKANFDRWLTIPQSYVDLGYTYYIDTVITGKIAETTAPDPTTFVIKLKAPNSAFLVTLTLTPFTFSSPAALEAGKASDPDFKNNVYAQGGPPAAVGTGPFKFKEWVPGDHVTLEKNAEYWNAAAGGPYLDAITFKPKRIATPVGTLGQILYAINPKSMDYILNSAYHMFPDSSAAKGGSGGGSKDAGAAARRGTSTDEQASNQQLAFAYLMRGVHW